MWHPGTSALSLARRSEFPVRLRRAITRRLMPLRRSISCPTSRRRDLEQKRRRSFRLSKTALRPRTYPRPSHSFALSLEW